jgi:arylsulfatase A-like enzyme
MNLSIRPTVELRLQQKQDYLSNIRAQTHGARPNVIIIFVDDMGWGDTPVMDPNNTRISTPNLQRLADEGYVNTEFYASSPVCSPSRFGLLTGRYGVRGHVTNVFFPTVTGQPLPFMRYYNPLVFRHGVEGILPDEITITEVLKNRGYATGGFGKWHLGDYGGYLPTAHGFDTWFGSYYSNDMAPFEMRRNGELVTAVRDVDQRELTNVLTDEILGFIEDNADNPFFVYYSAFMPHYPQFASEKWAGTSGAGIYGDSIQELDRSVGQIMNLLDEKGIADDTIIMFSSDNGPWQEGDGGGFRGRKGVNFDGGQKVPFILRYPNSDITAGTRSDTPAMNIDVFPTLLRIMGLPLPRDRIIDGVSLVPDLSGEPHDIADRFMYFIKGRTANAVRRGDYKYYASISSENSAYWHQTYRNYLFDIRNDPRESWNIGNHAPYNDFIKNLLEELDENLSAFNRDIRRNPRGFL